MQRIHSVEPGDAQGRTRDFTNFLNNVADTTLDIPQSEPLQACSVNGDCGCK